MSRAQAAPTTNMRLAARALEMLRGEFPGGASADVLAEDLFEEPGHVRKALAYLVSVNKAACDRINGQWIYKVNEKQR